MQEPIPDESLQVRVIDDERRWDELAADWSALIARSPQASATLRFDWLRTWWRIYGPVYGGRHGGLRIITVWRAGHLLAVLPLYRASASRNFGLRCLRFLSTGEAEHEETCPDYLNLLCAPGEEEACMQAVQTALHAMPWDQVELLDVPQGSPLVKLAGAPLPRAVFQAMPRGTCPIADLEGGCEAYLQRLSANTRQRARRLLREAARRGVLLELADADNFHVRFDDLVRLHQQRWTSQGKPGCFASKRFTEFHRTLACRWVPDGQAVLARMSLAGRPLAALYGFVQGSKFDEYQSGMATGDAGIQSPGIVARLLLMQALAERGITRYDFLRGSQAFKASLATDHVAMWAFHARRHSVPAAALTLLQAGCRAAGKAIRRLIEPQVDGATSGLKPDARARETLPAPFPRSRVGLQSRCCSIHLGLNRRHHGDSPGGDS